MNNVRGDRNHEEQTVANSKGKRTSEGGKIKGRMEVTRDAAVNAVASGLVQEIMEAVIRSKLSGETTTKVSAGQRGTKRRRTQCERNQRQVRN